MRRRIELIIAFGLIAFLVVDLFVAFELGKYTISAYQQTAERKQEHSPFFSGAVILGLLDGAAWLWHTFDKDHDAIIAASTVAIFIVTTALAIYTALLWTATVKLGDEAKKTSDSAIKIAQDDFIQTNRPWVSADYALRKLETTPNGVAVTILFVLKNTGKSPALEVDISPSVFPLIGEIVDLQGAQRAAAEAARNRTGAFLTVTLFPGDIIPREITTTLTNEEIARHDAFMDKTFANNEIGKPAQLQQFLPMFSVIGCISYRFAFGQREIHQTGFILDITRIDPARGYMRMMIPRFTGEFPLEELNMSSSVMGAGTTD